MCPARAPRRASPRCSSCRPTRRRSGPSPKAVAAYNAVAAHLEDYPDGSASELREAIGRVFGLDPDRIVCGAGSDDLLNLLARAYLADGDEAIHTTHGFLVYPIATLGTGAKPVVAPETDYTADVDAILARVTAKTKVVFLANPNNPTGTYMPFDEVKRLHEALPRHVLFVIDAAYAEYVRRNDYEAGIELVATSDNVVMCRTFSKIYGLAALRLGWMYGPAHVVDAINRIRGPFNVNAPAIKAGIAAIEDTAHQEKAREHNDEVARLAYRRNRQARPEGDAERRQFRADPFPGRPRQRGRRQCVPDEARAGAAPGRRLQAAERVAHDGRQRGGQPAGGQGAGGVPGEAGVTKLQQPIYNRLALIGAGLIGGSIARAARAQGAARSIVVTARSAATRKRVAELGFADQVVETNAAAVEGADLVIVCIPVGASRRGRQGDRPASDDGATVSDVGSVKGAVVRDMAPSPARRACISSRRIRSPAPRIPAPTRALPNCSSTAGASSRRRTDADKAAVERLAAFWRALGANVESMPADHHDLVLAVTSHLPHLIAYTIVGTADELGEVTRSEVLKFSAGGFRDFTRIAASDPTMWRDVFLANKDAVLEMLGRFSEDLSALTRAMRSGDGQALYDHFARTRAIRRGIVEIGQDSPAPDFGRGHQSLPAEPLPRPYAADTE